EHGYYFIESFAGFGAATHEVKTLFPKKKSVAMDILYSSSLVAAERAARNPDGRQAPCRDYLDSSGKRRFHGTPELKRKYTQQFGANIARELENLIQHSPRPIAPAPEEDALQIWASWEWDDVWECAKMPQLVAYLYGAKQICIP
ncbi:unnamed protein product, partial [Symbiodinium pilosum]